MPTIVVIAKDRDLRDLLRAMLVEQRVAVVAAADPIEAVARIAAMEEVPDAIILDRRIARGAESELVAWIRERSRLADVPIVLFTTNGAGGLTRLSASGCAMLSMPTS
jgi:DNA-binding response OmpR family regulator